MAAKCVLNTCEATTRNQCSGCGVHICNDCKQSYDYVWIESAYKCPECGEAGL